MKKPVILAVDDDPQVLGAVEHDLRHRYRKDYRVLKSASSTEALETVEQLRQRGDAVALFLVDQRMPQMAGTEFLARARKMYPDARKVLLTAYADTEAAITAINEVELDHYLMKPWHPPEDSLYPVLDDLLGDWKVTARLPYDGIRVAGTLWSASSHKIKDFLARSQIPYQWLNIETDPEAAEITERANEGSHKLPVVFFPDGTTLVEPSITELAEKAGLQTKASLPFYELIVIGAGPAGLAAAVYGASEGVQTLLIDKESTGGQAGTSSRIENYLGFPKGLSGADLARRATAQATRLGAEILTAQEVKTVGVKGSYRTVALADGTELSCRAVVLATGASVLQLDAPGVRELTGAGVYYGAAITEAAYYKDQHIYVIGGANSAGQGAMFFSRYASQVTMLVRKSLSQSMSAYLIKQIEDTPNIDVQLDSEVVEVHGGDSLEAITIVNHKTGETRREETPALFVFIGARPHTAMVADLVQLSDAGFVLTGTNLKREKGRIPGWTLDREPYLMETNVPGIFAAGDVRHGVVRRVASAVGEGSIVVFFVQQYLKSV